MGFAPAISAPQTSSNRWEHIQTQVLSGAAATISFTAGLQHDMYRLYAALVDNATAYPIFTLNNDTTAANYDSQTSKYGATASTNVIETAPSGAVISTLDSTTAHSDFLLAVFGKTKTTEEGCWFGMRKNGGTTTVGLDFGGGQWTDVANKITRIDLTASAGTFFGIDSSVRLEGLAVT